MTHSVRRGDQEGQTTVEYILLIAIVAMMVFAVFGALRDSALVQAFASPINEEMAAAYQYGHPKAKGPEQGTPKKHPRFFIFGGDNGRIFGNPERL